MDTDNMQGWTVQQRESALAVTNFQFATQAQVAALSVNRESTVFDAVMLGATSGNAAQGRVAVQRSYGTNHKGLASLLQADGLFCLLILSAAS